jgi:hypothetical protein
MKFFRDILVVALSFLFLFTLLVGGTNSLTSVPVFAQNTTSNSTTVLGFSGCSFSDSNGKPTGNSASGCIRQLLTFSVVIGVFLMAFRIGLAGLNKFNPLDGGAAGAKDAVNIVREITIGILLIGAPGLVLGLVSSDLVRIDFLNLNGFTNGVGVPTLKINNGGGTSSTTGGAGTGGVASGPAVSGVTTTQLSAAFAAYNLNPNDATAKSTLSTILSLNSRCNSAFTNNYPECQILKTGDFPLVLSKVTPNLLGSLGIANVEAPRSISGPQVNVNDLTIAALNRPALVANGCTTNYFSVTSATTGTTNYSTTDCGGLSDTSGLTSKIGDAIFVNPGVLPAGTVFNRDFTIIN